MKRLVATKDYTVSSEKKVLNKILLEYKETVSKMSNSKDSIYNDSFATLLCNCICNHFKIESHIISISILTSVHEVLVVKIDSKYYLVDLTYKKYFDEQQYKITKINKNQKFNGGINFFIDDAEKLSFVNRLIQSGYFECTPENMKIYCDPFVLVNYNKNRKNKDIVYTSSISGEEYFSNMILRKSNIFSNVDNAEKDRSEVDVKIKQKK